MGTSLVDADGYGFKVARDLLYPPGVPFRTSDASEKEG
jgi:hypothetical protein